MPRRSTSLTNDASVDITREIASKYDKVKTVADNIETIETLADLSIPDLESLVENGVKGLTPSYTFFIDSQGNLVYEVSYIDLVDIAVEEW